MKSIDEHRRSLSIGAVLEPLRSSALLAYIQEHAPTSALL
jgi:hypothetical protein